MNLNPEEVTALYDVASYIGVLPNDLDKLIKFESGWNPQAENKNSSAKGLIQFIDSTARSLGYRDSADLVSQYPDRVSQLRGPVLRYFRKYMPIPDRQALAMSVFYPAYRYVPPLTEFPLSVQKVNPGIRTVRDYLYKVYSDSGPILAALAVVAGVTIFIFTRKGGSLWREKIRRV